LGILLFCYQETANSNINQNNENEIILSEETIISQETEEAQIQEKSETNNSFSAKTSWYMHGRITANGERFNPLGMTVAHKSLPFGTIVRFTNPENGQTVVVRVNDRGPFIRGREFDLSLGSARVLGIEKKGVATLMAEIM
jgi:rare lipoprotein A